jgi:hypothetical protein
MDRNVARNNRPAGYIHETSAETPDPGRKRDKKKAIYSCVLVPYLVFAKDENTWQ